MKLKIGNIQIKDVQLGTDNSLQDGVLTINKQEAISFMKAISEEK